MTAAALAPGTYTITQSAIGNWPLTDLTCTTDELVDLGARRATITLGATEHAVCTFTNRTQSLTIVEEAVPDATQEHTFTGCLGTGCSTFRLQDAPGGGANRSLTGTALANSQRVQAGIRDVLLTGNLHNKPVAIVAGRSDALVPVNHAGRAYTAFNSKVEGAANIRYYEIENGNHFDAFLPNAAAGGVQGYDVLLVPVHYYFNNAMDLVWARLKNNTPLPQSQVVRAIPRGGVPGSAPAITTANVPKIATTPSAANTISVGAGVINVPN